MENIMLWILGGLFVWLMLGWSGNYYANRELNKRYPSVAIPWHKDKYSWLALLGIGNLIGALITFKILEREVK